MCPLELTKGSSDSHQELSCSGVAPNHQYLEDVFKYSDHLRALKVHAVEWIYAPDLINVLHHNNISCHLLNCLIVKYVEVKSWFLVRGPESKKQGKPKALITSLSEFIS